MNIPRNIELDRRLYRQTQAVKLARNVAASGLFAFCIVGFYIQIGIVFPYSVYIITGIALLVVLDFRKVYLRIWLLTMALGTTSLVSVLLLPDSWNLFAEQISSLGLLALSVIASLGLYAVATSITRKLFCRFFLTLSVAIVIAAVLEVSGPLSSFSDSFRTIAYSQEILYSNDSRDINSAGFVRPKVFTSEPSHVAKMLGLFLALAALSSRTLGVKLFILALWIGGFVFIGSPAIAVGLFVSLSDIVLFSRQDSRLNKHLIRLVIFVMLVAGLLLILLFASKIYSRFGIGGLQIEPSVFLRLFAPWMVAINVILSHPLFGFGLGADSSLKVLIDGVMSSGIAPEFVQSRSYDGVFGYGNLHAGTLIQFGLIGSFLWLRLLEFIRRRLCGFPGWIFWGFYFFTGWLVAPINTPLFWGQLALILAALRHIHPGYLSARSRVSSAS